MKSLIEEKSIPVTESGCWIWTGAGRYDGYGKYGNQYAHRLSYKAYVGDIPIGKQVNHTCDNRCCVNPDHLYCGTQQENMLDKVRRGRQQDTHGESHPSNKLTEEDVKEIRYQRACGVPLTKIHENFSFVSYSAIRHCCSGSSWRDVL